MEKETVFFSENIPLLATIGYPDHGKGPFPAVVILHGHARHRNDGLDAYAKYLNDRGFATLRFDFRGCGETMYERYNIICHAHCPEDAFNAVSFMMTQENVDPNRIGITGISMGGCTTIYAAGTDARVKCAVSLAALADIGENLKAHLDARFGEDRYRSLLKMVDADRYERVKTGHSGWVFSSSVGAFTEDEAYATAAANTNDRIWGMANSNYMTLASVESLLKYRPIEKCAGIKIPMLILHGEMDELVYRKQAYELFEAIPDDTIKKVQIMEGIDHNMPIHPRRDEVFEAAAAWFEEYL